MAIKYVPYFPNTLEGQAVLDNFVRTKRVLRYRDNDQVIERVQRGMPLYEMELKEQIGQNEADTDIQSTDIGHFAFVTHSFIGTHYKAFRFGDANDNRHKHKT